MQPGSVTVTVQQRPVTNEVLTITGTDLQARTNNRWNWDVNGTSNLTNANTITIQVTSSTGLVTLGTATVAGNGRWRFAANNTQIAPSANPTVTIRSSFGTTQTAPVVQSR
ncbi:hypothetical protein D9M70_547350 [compost metagenome]